jgi:hypothetical protein
VFGQATETPQARPTSEVSGRPGAKTLVASAVIALFALLVAAPHARGNFIYWSSASPNSSIGRAKINGTGLNNNFITGLGNPTAVAVDSRFIYWSDLATNKIGSANLDGSGVNQNFITTGVNSPRGIAVGPSGIYWANDPGGTVTIGHANVDGTNPVGNFITTPATGICGLAADSNFVYWSDGNNIDRAPVNGGAPNPNFVTGANFFCGPAVDPNFVYWATDSGNHVGRAPVGGGAADNNFIPAGTTGGGPTDVAVNSQYVFWGDLDAKTIGRANINGSAPNHDLIAGASITGPVDPSQFAAAPSNKITINSVTRKKKKGTAAINAKVPGPGQVTLNQTSTPPDVNATAANVKQIGLTITQAASFTVPVKPQGKTAKKLNKQVKKKGHGKVKVKVFIHFVPAGVSGVPNTQQITVTLIKQGKKK